MYAHLFADSCVNMVEGHPYWRDVGTVDAFWEANMDLTRVAPELNMYDPQWPIRTLEEHLPPAKFVFESPDPRGQAFQSTGLEWLHRERRFPHTLDGRSPASSSSAAPSSRIRCCCPRSVSVATCRLRHAIVDKFCVIPDGLSAGFNRTHDKARFHVTPRGATLITPEMLGQAMHDCG